ncbi:MAG: hypothetical protein AAGJ82_07425 [Bacteroidota bacterium]
MSRKTKVTITTEDLVFAGVGVVAGLAINPLANKALEGQSESIRNTVGTALPAAKLIGGGYLAMQKKMDRRARWFGVGVSAEGAGEIALRYIPSNFVSIQGVDGDIFSMIGQTVEIPINPSVSSALPAGGIGFEEDAILGTENVYADMEEMVDMI